MLVSYQTAGEVNTAVPGVPFTITLDETTLTGSSGCNAFGGAFRLGRQGQFEMGEMNRTAQECAGDLLTRQETAVLQQLQQANQLKIENNQLKIFNDTEQLLFQPYEPVPLSYSLDGFYDVEWSLVALETSSGFLPADNIIMTMTPEEITGFGGCNTFIIHPLIVESAHLVQFGHMSYGFESCDFATNELERAFFRLLETAVSFELSDESLLLYAPTGSLSFRR